MKREALGLGLVEELDRAGVAVAGLEGEAPRRVLDLFLLLAREDDAGGLLDDLLVAALARAVAHARGPRLALAVGDQLHLDVVRVADHRLHEDGAVAEGALGLGARLVFSAFSSSDSSSTLRMPRPPPPAAALIISG